jgi:hypothetical protein
MCAAMPAAAPTVEQGLGGASHNDGVVPQDVCLSSGCGARAAMRPHIIQGPAVSKAAFSVKVFAVYLAGLG